MGIIAWIVLGLIAGFIARAEDGGTAILGRGGSDTSAAYFGALLRALRVEIWTDVPGMFSANPRDVPDAIGRPVPGVEVKIAERGEVEALGELALPMSIGPLEDGAIPPGNSPHSCSRSERTSSKPAIPSSAVATRNPSFSR